MKSKSLLLIATFSTSMSFICSYFFDLYMGNIEQYMALVGVLWIDGIFGIIAGTKREGFQTRKAVHAIKRVIGWIMFLTVILMIEKGFQGTAWLSETIMVPFLVLQIISALKNASMAGFIKIEELNKILDRIDNHKGTRQ